VGQRPQRPPSRASQPRPRTTRAGRGGHPPTGAPTRPRPPKHGRSHRTTPALPLLGRPIRLEPRPRTQPSRAVEPGPRAHHSPGRRANRGGSRREHRGRVRRGGPDPRTDRRTRYPAGPSSALAGRAPAPPPAGPRPDRERPLLTARTDGGSSSDAGGPLPSRLQKTRPRRGSGIKGTDHRRISRTPGSRRTEWRAVERIPRGRPGVVRPPRPCSGIPRGRGTR